MIISYERGDQPLKRWAKDVEFLDTKIEFSKGLNLIVGPNGSGKSTLLDSIKQTMLVAEEGYHHIEGLSDIGKFVDSFSGTTSLKFTDRVVHTGSPITCVKNRITESKLSWTGTAQDMLRRSEDFQSSEGQKQKLDWFDLLNSIEKRASGTECVEAFLKKSVNSHYRDISNKWLEWYLEGISEIHIPDKGCVLFDESTSMLDAENKAIIWGNIKHMASKGWQVIIASHDFIPWISNMECNIIETCNNYYAKVDKLIKNINDF